MAAGSKPSKGQEKGGDPARVARAAAKAQRKHDVEMAEQEEAERISNLPRRSKEKAKQDKIWMSTQTARVTRGNPAQALEQGIDNEVNAANNDAGARKKKRTASKKPSENGADGDKDTHAQRNSKRTVKDSATKQKPASAARPVLNRALLDDDAHPEALLAPPLPAKTVVVKPKRTSASVSKKATVVDKPALAPVKTNAKAAKHAGSESDELDDETSEESSFSESTDSEDFSSSSDGDKPKAIDSDGSCEDDANYDEEDKDDEDDEDEDEDGEPADTLVDEVAIEVQDLAVSRDGEGQGPESEHSESETPALAASGKRKHKESKGERKSSKKKQKRLEDRPRMREVADAQPTTTRIPANIKTVVAGPDAKSKKGRPCAHHTGRINQANLTKWEADYQPVTRLVYNEKHGINLNSQSESIKVLGQAVIKKFHHVMTFEHGFFPAEKRFQMQRDLVIEVAQKLDVDKHIMDRLRNNDLYVKMFTKMADLRNVQFLGKVMKRNAETYVQAQYGLPIVATPEEIANRGPSVTEEQAKRLPTKQHVARLLSSLAFAHSGVTFNAAGKPSVDSDKILDLPIVGSVLADSYFASDRRGRASIAANNTGLFRSSDYYRSQEVEVPVSMVALACAAIGEALRGWSEGVHNRKDLNSTTAEEQYDTCMHLLNELRADKPDRYHKIMHNLYVSASGGMPQVLKNSANKEGALKMIRFVDDDQPEAASASGAGEAVAAAT